MKITQNDLVSIVMLSRNGGRFVEQSVKSVMAQTYTNWELLIYSSYFKGQALNRMMEMMDKDSRIQVFQVMESENELSRNLGLRDARERWMAFLDCGDLWEPGKLERQIAFMEKHHYHFSYTKYKKINSFLWLREAIYGGPKKLTRKDFIRCCSPGYMSVMYDTEMIGIIQIVDLRYNNDYALWLKVSEKANCYLLPECLAKLRSPQSTIMEYLFTDKLSWRYRVYRWELGKNLFVAIWMTLRCLYYASLKRVKYVEKL